MAMNSTTLARSCAAIAMCLVLPAAAALAAGIQALNVPADGSSPALSGAVWYPCAIAPTEMKLGPFLVSATKDCPVVGKKLPLIVISHACSVHPLAHRKER